MSVMNKIKVSEATNIQLDWLVWNIVGGAAAYPKTVSGKAFSKLWHGNSAKYIHPSTDWSHLGPIIERETMDLVYYRSYGEWGASKQGDGGVGTKGPTPLIAAARCYVMSKLGVEVLVPEELT